MKLEKQLERAFESLDICENQQASLMSYVDLVRDQDELTYEHCVRVALMGMQIGELMDLDKKALFYAGLLHDVGKALIPRRVLQKTLIFTDEDYKLIKKHSLYGYWMLKDYHAFSAEVIIRHHRHKGKGYPEELPTPGVPFTEPARKLIEEYAELISVIDFYDAASTRANEKFGKKGKLDALQVKTLLAKAYPEKAELIEKFYYEDIFGK